MTKAIEWVIPKCSRCSKVAKTMITFFENGKPPHSVEGRCLEHGLEPAQFFTLKDAFKVARRIEKKPIRLSLGKIEWSSSND